MDFENICIWCWLIPLLVGVLCAILGYLIGKGSGKRIDEGPEIRRLREENAKLTANLEEWQAKLPKPGTEGDPPAATGSTGGSAAAFAAGTTKSETFDAAAAKAAMGKKVHLNDLKIVEGIGPKIEGLFHNFDIKTWKALADCSVSKCQEVLDSGGERYRVHDPASWPMQARMCAEGRWKDLARWQDEHKHGKL